MYPRICNAILTQEIIRKTTPDPCRRPSKRWWRLVWRVVYLKNNLIENEKIAWVEKVLLIMLAVRHNMSSRVVITFLLNSALVPHFDGVFYPFFYVFARFCSPKTKFCPKNRFSKWDQNPQIFDFSALLWSFTRKMWKKIDC